MTAVTPASSTTTSSKTAPVLQVSQVHKRYGATVALEDASLELHPSSVHALVGENGAGKSTLIKILAGAVSPDGGVINLDGAPLTLHNPQDAFQAGLRFIHQELQLVPTLSVAENLFLQHPYPNRGGLVSWRKLNRAAQQVLDVLGIDLSPKQTVGRLAVGEKMLVNVARAFADHQPDEPAKVYVMDEPTAALSRSECDTLFAVIERLKAQGAAVLYVSHRMEEIFQVCDTITVMRDGRTLTRLNVPDTSENDIIQLMTGRAVQQHYPERQAPVGDEVVLEVKGGSSHPVSNLNFTVNAGDILGIAGLAGSGRSEVLRLLLGIDRLCSGDVILNGQRLKKNAPSQAWSRGIAYIPEERRSQGLLLGRSLSDNITLPHLSALSRVGTWLNPTKEQRVSQQLGEDVRLKARAISQKSRQLSGGNQQKVLFARALAENPRLLLLDEPTRGIDVAAKQDIYRLLREQSRRGIAVVMVSSDLNELLGMCERVLVMNQGTQTALEPTRDLSEDSLLQLCYADPVSR